jgi:hypothetical protein
MISKMPQFDLLSTGAQIFGLLSLFSLFYLFHIQESMPLFVETKKCRNKKVIKNNIELTTIDKDLDHLKNKSGDITINFL